MTHGAERLVRNAPRYSVTKARALGRNLFGVDATVTLLPSERDQNFRLDLTDGRRLVLKVANADERVTFLELQNEAMARIRERWTGPDGTAPCPEIVPSIRGASIEQVDSEDGKRHSVRLLTWVPGRPFGEERPHTTRLLRSLGSLLGRVDLALEGFDTPAAHREFHWDLSQAESVVRDVVGELDDATRSIVEGLLAEFESRSNGRLDSLRRAVIHGDGNDYNVMVQRDEIRAGTATGLIDFGDMLHGWVVAEPAIAAAYAMLGKSDPLAAAREVFGGFHDIFPLTEAEAEIAWSLIGMRLAQSYCLAARQKRNAPDNAYLTISEAPVRALLERLSGIDANLGRYTLRGACGYPPCPQTASIVSWLNDRRGGQGEPGPVVEPDPAAPGVPIFDLGVSSTEFDEPGLLDDTARFTEALFARMRQAGASVGLGRYDEVRPIYAGDQFRCEADEFPERRTVHLGVDLFVEAGSTVSAPLAGVVESVRDNDQPYDYGPTVILRHPPTSERPGFHTLYGHLSRESIRSLEPGREVAVGESFARVGPYPENGNWPPHLHFQLIVDLLGTEGNFPGVAAPTERDVWRSLCPDPNLILRIPGLKPADNPTDPSVLEARRATRLAPSLSLAYRRPLQIVRGRGAYLFDEAGQAYLDCVNNVCHVGHCHPRVARAGRAQISLLNTNTRYLHPTILEYAERLAATFPDPLGVCLFVCSGSEANELALRIARTATGRRGTITVAGAYHGHTQALIDVSPYKNEGPGGRGAPAWVEPVPLPDTFRGPFRSGEPDVGSRYADAVRQAAELLSARGEPAGAFICESLPGCGGQIVLPDGYLEAAYRHARAAGAVCIADEVQVGFGRVGSHFWGFETQGVVPDIVTLGKPIGNGHPLAAVVTTRELADAFDNGMEYFNTFGGNPVSCAIGLAVLDVLRDEGLQAHAAGVGDDLRQRLVGLQQRHPAVGDVRGSGLFLGVELVVPGEDRCPDPGLAAYVVERMRELGILLSSDGPDHNVIKIKPPLPFSQSDGERLAINLDRVLFQA